MMTDEIAAARFRKAGKPCDTSPRDTLAALYRDIETGDIEVDKIIVVYASPADEDGRVSVGWYQGGPSSLAESVGLLHRAAWVMNTDPE